MAKVRGEKKEEFVFVPRANESLRKEGNSSCGVCSTNSYVAVLGKDYSKSARVTIGDFD